MLTRCRRPRQATQGATRHSACRAVLPGRPTRVTDFVGDAVSERLTGGQPSRFRSIGAAIVIGVGAGMLAYRVFRSGSGDSD